MAGRPQKNNAEYFPHYTTMRNHRKIKMLRNRFGSVLGYAFWCMFLEILAENDGLEIEDSEFNIESIASELGADPLVVRDMVEYCIKIELLFRDELNFIKSESLNEYLAPMFEKRKRERDASKTKKRRAAGKFTSSQQPAEPITATEMPITATVITPAVEIPATEIRQSKVNKSKAKQSKETPTGSDAGASGEVVKSKEVFNAVKAGFLDFYKTNFKEEYYFTATDASKIKSLLKKVRFKMVEKSGAEPNADELIGSMDFFFNQCYFTAKDWLLSNFTLPILESKFNELFIAIKNGQANTNRVNSGPNTRASSNRPTAQQRANNLFNGSDS